MNTKKIVKAEIAVSGVEETKVDREYRRPEVHDLGKLEQVQGNIVGIFGDDRGLIRF
jgi:hypothetical protein